MKNKIGLVLSHVFVRNGEHNKWDWINHSISMHKNLYDNFFIVLSGHGESIPNSIKQQIDTYYWQSEIQEKEIGYGHPTFCIVGYEECIKNGCEYTLKNRAFDWIENDIISTHNRTFCSTNTNFAQKQLGDLFMFGKTNEMLALWKRLPWNYNLTDGLENLYRNMLHLWGTKKFLDETTFFNSYDLGWKTMWDFKGNGPKYWGV